MQDDNKVEVAQKSWAEMATKPPIKEPKKEPPKETRKRAELSRRVRNLLSQRKVQLHYCFVQKFEIMLLFKSLLIRV